MLDTRFKLQYNKSVPRGKSEALGEKTLPLLLGRDPSNIEKIFKKLLKTS